MRFAYLAVSYKSLDEIRTATNKAWVLGSKYFVDQVASQINRQARPIKRGGRSKDKGYIKGNRVCRR